MTAPSLRCPVCADELSLRAQQSCPTCETPVHADCREYIGGCARFACPEAATPRGRVLEFVTVCLDQQLLSSRALTRCLAAWIAICTVVGLYGLKYYPTGGNLGFSLPSFALLQLLGAYSLHLQDPQFIICRLGFAIPVVAWIWASGRLGRLKEVRSRLQSITSTSSGQLALLQTFAPNAKRSGLGAVVGPTAQVVGVCAIAAGLYMALTWMMGWGARSLPASKVTSGPHVHITTTYSVSGEATLGYVLMFVLLGVALMSLGRSVKERWRLHGRSLRLANLWREELEIAKATAHFDTELKSGKQAGTGQVTRPSLQSENPADIKRQNALLQDSDDHQ